MPFVASRETLEALMGPAVRTESTSVAEASTRTRGSNHLSARRPSFARSRSEGSHKSDTDAHSPCLAKWQSPVSSNSPFKLPMLPALLHPDAHSPRRNRRLKHYSRVESFERSGRMRLTPVMECDLSLTDGDDSSSFPYIRQRRSRDNIHSLPSSTTAIPPSLALQGGSLVVADIMLEAVPAGKNELSSMPRKRQDIVAHENLERDLSELYRDLSCSTPSHEVLTLHTTVSTPDLTCASSFSSQDDEDDDEAASRSSISSVESIRSISQYSDKTMFPAEHEDDSPLPPSEVSYTLPTSESSLSMCSRKISSLTRPSQASLCKPAAIAPPPALVVRKEARGLGKWSRLSSNIAFNSPRWSFRAGH